MSSYYARQSLREQKQQQFSQSQILLEEEEVDEFEEDNDETQCPPHLEHLNSANSSMSQSQILVPPNYHNNNINYSRQGNQNNTRKREGGNYTSSRNSSNNSNGSRQRSHNNKHNQFTTTTTRSTKHADNPNLSSSSSSNNGRSRAFWFNSCLRPTTTTTTTLPKKQQQQRDSFNNSHSTLSQEYTHSSNNSHSSNNGGGLVNRYASLLGLDSWSNDRRPLSSGKTPLMRRPKDSSTSNNDVSSNSRHFPQQPNYNIRPTSRHGGSGGASSNDSNIATPQETTTTITPVTEPCDPNELQEQQEVLTPPTTSASVCSNTTTVKDGNKSECEISIKVMKEYLEKAEAKQDAKVADLVEKVTKELEGSKQKNQDMFDEAKSQMVDQLSDKCSTQILEEVRSSVARATNSLHEDTKKAVLPLLMDSIKVMVREAVWDTKRELTDMVRSEVAAAFANRLMQENLMMQQLQRLNPQVVSRIPDNHHHAVAAGHIIINEQSQALSSITNSQNPAAKNNTNSNDSHGGMGPALQQNFPPPPQQYLQPGFYQAADSNIDGPSQITNEEQSALETEILSSTRNNNSNNGQQKRPSDEEKASLSFGITCKTGTDGDSKKGSNTYSYTDHADNNYSSDTYRDDIIIQETETSVDDNDEVVLDVPCSALSEVPGTYPTPEAVKKRRKLAADVETAVKKMKRSTTKVPSDKTVDIVKQQEKKISSDKPSPLPVSASKKNNKENINLRRSSRSRKCKTTSEEATTSQKAFTVTSKPSVKTASKPRIRKTMPSAGVVPLRNLSTNTATTSRPTLSMKSNNCGDNIVVIASKHQQRRPYYSSSSGVGETTYEHSNKSKPLVIKNKRQTRKTRATPAETTTAFDNNNKQRQEVALSNKALERIKKNAKKLAAAGGNDNEGEIRSILSLKAPLLLFDDNSDSDDNSYGCCSKEKNANKDEHKYKDVTRRSRNNSNSKKSTPMAGAKGYGKMKTVKQNKKDIFDYDW